MEGPVFVSGFALGLSQEGREEFSVELFGVSSSVLLEDMWLWRGGRIEEVGNHK